MVGFIKVIQLIEKEAPPNTYTRIPNIINVEEIRRIAFIEDGQAELYLCDVQVANKKADDTLENIILIEVLNKKEFLNLFSTIN